jgi:predicted nucleic-acid-binding protein
MIGLDTNALVRWLLADALDGEDAAQAQRVERALEAGGDVAHVNPVVLVECLWVLRARFGRSRTQIADLVQALLAAPQIDIARRGAVESALDSFRRGGPGFADHLIAALNREAGCTVTLTFDRAAAAAPGFGPVP